MPLKLNDLLKKAEQKGISQKDNLPSPVPLLRPWQHESILYSDEENKGESNSYKTDNKAATNQQQSDNNTNNRQQSTNKQATNWQQNSDNKSATMWTQTTNKEKTNRQQTDNPSETNRQQTDNETGNITDNKLITIRQQSVNTLTTKISFSEIVGLQREIIIFISNECKNSRSRITEALTLEHIATSLKRSVGTIKTTIQRLERKGCLYRVGFKNGRGGWSRYELPEYIYHEALRNETVNKSITNWQQTDSKSVTELTTKSATDVSSSSSSNINITTELCEEWNFDISPYARFGFTKVQIMQLAALNIIPAIDVEQSLIEFSFDLDNNALEQRIKTTKTNYLMGLLRAGRTYVSEGYRSALEAEIAEMGKRAEAKRKKLQEEKFLSWYASLSDIEKKQIEQKLPTHFIVLYRAHGIDNRDIKNWLFDYFCREKSDIDNLIAKPQY